MGVTLGAALSALTANAEVYWVNGVTEESGWYDANKTPSYAYGDDGYYWDDDEIKGDISTCHAAAAANLIAWWQDRYKGKKLPDGVPTDAQEIWQTYKEHQIRDTAGTVSYSLQWWLTGVNVPDSDDETESARQAARTRDGHVSSVYNSFSVTNGYYYDEYLSPFATGEIEPNGSDKGLSAELRSFFNFQSFEENAEGFAAATAAMTTAIQAGQGVALQLTYDGGSHHALTLWGLEKDITSSDDTSIQDYLDDNVTIHKLWLTDSDDSKTQYGGFTDPSLFYVYVSENNDTGLMTIMNHGGADTNATSDRGLDTFTVTGITTVDPRVSDKWFAAAMVPEPTTATLSLLGLLTLAVRRRRR